MSLSLVNYIGTDGYKISMLIFRQSDTEQVCCCLSLSRQYYWNRRIQNKYASVSPSFQYYWNRRIQNKYAAVQNIELICVRTNDEIGKLPPG